ncbi:MAG TPA: DNA recombination protein RmuC, partial [Paraburkholderia sp.]
MTVNLPGERFVFVDAKAPIDSMQAALEAADDETRRTLVKRHARSLRDHVDALARRGYQTAKGSADYVVMFVPGEAFLSAACNDDPMLIEYALDQGVLVT